MQERDHRDKLLRKLLRNVFWLFLQLGVVRLCSFAVTILLARGLTQDDYGRFSYTVSLIGMFLVVSDIGLSSVLLREASRRRAETAAIFTRTARVKAPLVAAVYLFFCAFVLVTARDGARPALVLGAAFFAESLARFFATAFNANEKMHMLLIGDAVHKLVLLGLLWAVLRSSPVLLPVAFTYLAASVLLLLYYVAAYHRDFGWARGAAPPEGGTYATLATAAPMALGGLIMAAYVNTDVILLKWLKGPAVTGAYAACYNFYLGIGVVSAFMVQAVVPRLSASLESGTAEESDFILCGTVKGLCMLALPLAVGGFALSREVLSLFYGAAYAGAAPAFRVFMCTVPVNFLNLLFSYYLFVSRHQGEINKVYVASLLLNVALNLVLIPSSGAAGAAIATLAAESFFMTVFLARHTSFLSYFRLSWAAPLCLALAALALCATLIPAGAGFAARVAASAAAYAAVLAATGAVAGEMKFIRSLFVKGKTNAQTNIAG